MSERQRCRYLNGRQGGLVITRKGDESILVGDDVLIHVLNVQGNKARIRIVAPEGVPITRTELLTEGTDA